MEVKWKYKHILFFMTIAVLLVFANLPLEAEAASSVKIKKAYAKFLKKGGQKYKYFAVVNAGKKKEPILMVTGSREKREKTSPYARLYYYSGGNVKAVKGGEIAAAGITYPLAYRANHIFIICYHGGGTAIQVSKGHMVGKACILTYTSKGTEKYYTYSFKDGKAYHTKVASRAKYKKFNKKWSSSTPITFHKNHTKNRRKYLKGN